MLDTRITAVVALPTDSRLATQTVAEFYPRRSKPNLDKSDFRYQIGGGYTRADASKLVYAKLMWGSGIGGWRIP
jgi:hypothetical protein